MAFDFTSSLIRRSEDGFQLLHLAADRRFGHAQRPTRAREAVGLGDLDEVRTALRSIMAPDQARTLSRNKG